MSLLSHEFFVEIKKKNEEELSKFTDFWIFLLAKTITNRVFIIENLFGAEAGKLLFDEAVCEEKFVTVNVLNGSTMEPLDSPEFTPEQKKPAILNARDIERQILRLIRICSKREMRDKLTKEFGSVIKTTNEIDHFNE